MSQTVHTSIHVHYLNSSLPNHAPSVYSLSGLTLLYQLEWFPLRGEIATFTLFTSFLTASQGEYANLKKKCEGILIEALKKKKEKKEQIFEDLYIWQFVLSSVCGDALLPDKVVQWRV